MNTEQLIERLGRDSAAVPLPRPGARAAVWLLTAVTYLLLVTIVLRGRALVLPSVLGSSQMLLALATGAVAALAALASVVPGHRHYRGLLLAAGALWSVSILIGCWRDLQTLGAIGFARESDWPCVLSMTLGSAVLAVPLVSMLRRGAPLAPATTMSLAGIAALSVANIEACVTRAHEFTSTVLVWHGVTLAVGVLLLASLAPLLLRWPGRR